MSGRAHLNGSRPRVPRDPLRRAAAVRWLLAHKSDSAERVHEVLEFDAARTVLDRLEEFCPGLRDFVDYAHWVALLAASLQVAEPTGVPAALSAHYRHALEQALTELPQRTAQIQVEDPEGVLKAYAELADAAGILGFDRS